MEKRWTGKNVDLDLLREHIEDFFKEKGYTTERIEHAEERTISWAPQHAPKNVKEAMTVKIVGDSNDFLIKFMASELSRRSIWLGMLSKSLGGGYLLLRSLRLRETLEKLEREFWVYIEDKVARMAGSAKTT